MKADLKGQFVSALLFVLTVAAVCCAVINFRQQSIYRLPDDGVTWVDREAQPQPSGPGPENQVVALYVARHTGADNAGIRPGDVLVSIHGVTIHKAAQVPQVLSGVVRWMGAVYIVKRGGTQLGPVNVIIGEATPDTAIYYQYAVGAIYLLIGLFVYYRRGGAERSVHFYVLCLASFVLSCFHYTGKLNAFDKIIYWGNVAAGILAPTVFLHFCLIFPERRKWFNTRLRTAALYLPGAILLGVYALIANGILRTSAPLVDTRWFLDRVWLAYLAACYLAGAAALAMQYRRAEDPMVRRQMKYLRNGAILGIVPFAACYVLPYVFGAVPGYYQRLTVLSLVLIPATWAYAILRYRLMDVDIIFQQGYVYTLATLAVMGVFYGLLLTFTRPEDLSPMAIVGLILFATFIFQPVRDWLQEQLDRYLFYRDRYDYRRTLVEFGRELSSETDLDKMLHSVADRLVHTVSIQHVAFFLADGDGDGFRLHSALGNRKHGLPDAPDLSFLAAEPDKPYLFFERTRHLLDVVSHEWPVSVRRTIASLDLTYYFRCTVRGRTIAYLGLSRTDKGDFLSSEDVELLQTLSGYVGIAIENARLYRSLRSKVEEYERLKEFSENIVESINVGVLAVDHDDRVESWNTQVERLTGVPREVAHGQRLHNLFPADLCQQIDEVRGETGIHNIYKFVLKNGTSANGAGDHILNIAIAPLVAKDYQQIGRLIIFDDITDRDELERRLVQADKLSSIGLLAAGVAHEVNTPLAVISTYAQMLAKQVSEDEQKSRLLDKIAKQTFRASEIVNSLLNFSRTSTTEFVEVDVNRVIRETVALIQHQLEKAGVSVRLELENDGLPVKANPGKLQQVFLNLFLNARDAMEAGGVLTVATSVHGGTGAIDVSDTGQGIPPEILSRIYDPFFTTKGARKGTGLGLAITYGIVREHSGTIEVESQAGAGTRFHVELPLALARKLVHA